MNAPNHNFHQYHTVGHRWNHRCNSRSGVSKVNNQGRDRLLVARRIGSFQLLLLLLCFVVLLSPPNRMNIQSNNHVSAFRAISSPTSVSTSSSSSSSTAFSNITARQQQRIKNNENCQRNMQRTTLWQQQQQQQQQESKIADNATIDTTTTTTTLNDMAELEPKRGSNRRTKNSIVLLSALALLTACSIAAMTGVLPGYSSSSSLLDYTVAGPPVSSILLPILLRDVGSTILTGILGYAFVQCITYWTVTKQYIVSRDARKIIHILSAPLFIVFWPLFTSHHHPSSRIFAAIVPIVNGIRLYIAANSSTSTDDDTNGNHHAISSSESDLAQAVSRSGDSKEALGGPFIYVCMLAICILCFWTESPHGIIAMSTLAAGDGMADIIGRRYGTTNPWPYNTKKSIVGSLAFVLASSITSLSLILWIQTTNSGLLTLSSHYTTTEIATNIVFISIIAAIVETIPWLGDDNYTVPISAALLSILLFS